MDPFRSPKITNAFTMIELVAVMVLVGILAFNVVPRFFTTSVFGENFFFQDVLASIRYAQKLAVGMGCEIQVSITSSSLTLQGRQSCTSGTFNQAITEPGTGASTFVKNAPSGVSLASSSFPIYFDALGRAHISSGAVSDSSLTVNTQTVQVIGETGFTYAP